MSIVACNFGQRVAVLADGARVPITDFFDADGDDCLLEEAVMFVCGSDETGWFATPMADFDGAVMH